MNRNTFGTLLASSNTSFHWSTFEIATSVGPIVKRHRTNCCSKTATYKYENVYFYAILFQHKLFNSHKLHKSSHKYKCKYKKWIAFSCMLLEYELHLDCSNRTWSPSDFVRFEQPKCNSYSNNMQRNSIHSLIINSNVSISNCQLCLLFFQE